MEWVAAKEFFAMDKGAEMYEGKHIFLRAEDGQIYAMNLQDTQQIKTNLGQAKQWPQAIEAKGENDQITHLKLVASLFKTQYKPLSAADFESDVAADTTIDPTLEAPEGAPEGTPGEAIPVEPAQATGWRGKLGSLKQLAGQTMDIAKTEVNKASAQVSQGAEKSGWKDKLTGLKDKAGAQMGGLKDLKDKAGSLGGLKELKDKAGSQLSKATEGLGKAGSKIGAAAKDAAKQTEMKVKGTATATPEARGLAAIKSLQTQAAHLQQAAKAIREVKIPEKVDACNAIADAIDNLVEKLAALK
jgi:hypothetical protein